jgi:hypothetical protein
LKQIRRHLTYANVMSSIAVFLMLGGATAFAATKIGANEIKANSIKTGKIVKEAVTAGKIKNGAVTEAKLADGAVTNRKIADGAVSTTKIANDAVTGDKVKDSSLTGSDINLGTLGTVPTANNALNLGGAPASAYAKSALESVHLIGAAGEPAFENSCKNINPEFQPAGFYKDGFGVVHLVGDINGCSGETVRVFVLPPGFRPAKFERFISHKSDTTIGTIRVDPSGDVTTFSNATPVLNGMYFRTE